MHSQLTAQDFEDYGPQFLDLTRRAAIDAVGPELQQLRAQNAHLRQMAQRAQNATIEQTLDREVPDWRACYQNPAFSAWLAQRDDFSGGVRSALMRHAVDVGDAGRVVAFYKGFLAEGRHVPAGQQRAYQSRPAATGGNIYTRQQIADLYERRRKGLIDAATWAKWEPAIIKAANEGRIAGALDRDGNKLTELRR
jgi:hypothetical protein